MRKKAITKPKFGKIFIVRFLIWLVLFSVVAAYALEKYYDFLLERVVYEPSETYIKHIEGELYELRPLRDRFFFVYQEKDTYVILNHFVKKTPKTPKKEIETALRMIKERKQNENI